METIKIQAQNRQKTGVKGELSKLRAAKQIPATVYGAGKEPLSISFSEKDLLIAQKAGGSAIIELTLPSGKEEAIIKEVQYHAVKDNPIHVDFLRVKMDQEITTLVPVILVGVAEIVKTHGAMIEHVLREISVRALPKDLPHHIEADISKITLDKHISVGDLTAPKGVAFTDAADRMVVNAVMPREEAAAAPAADAPAGTAAQPELSAAKGKKEEEGAAPAKK